MTIENYEDDIKESSGMIEILNRSYPTINNHHILKLRSEFFEDVLNGRKTFEVRKNDRGFQKGDLVSFICVNEDGQQLDGIENQFSITYVLNGWGIKEDHVVFSIRRVL